MSTPSSTTDAFAYFEAERAQILQHKYFTSEKAGHDVGFERALKEWTETHRAQWRSEEQKQ